MYAFNDENFRNPGGKSTLSSFRLPETDTRRPFVRIVSFCLLPNHFHLLLQPLVPDGITQFMHRLGMGYARYFNTLYERTGCLFQGRFRAVHIKRDAQFIHIPRYIHLNALDLTDLEWREGRVTDWEAAAKFLNTYQWSSHGVYCGLPQSLPVIDINTAHNLFHDTKQYLTFLQSWSGRYTSRLPET